MPFNFDLKAVFSQPIVRSVAIAFFVNLLLANFINGEIADVVSLIIAFVVMTNIAYIISMNVSSTSSLSVGLTGAVSYATYNFIVLFFKITESEMVVKDELTAALVFGVITGLVFLLINRRRK